MLFRLLVMVALGLACISAQAAELSIENQFLTATWDQDSHQMKLLHKPSGTECVQDALVMGDQGKARKATVQDSTFGKGRAIQFPGRSGHSCSIQVFPGLPFVLLRSEVHNDSSSETIKNQIDVATFNIDWGVEAEAVRTFGTGGLLEISQNPGSYAWLAAVEPESRNGIVVGWITHDRGSGVLFSREKQGKLQIDARLDYGRVSIAPDESVPLETLAIGFFEDARLGLEAWADTVARVYEIALPEQPTGYCTWYSEPHGGASDEKHLAELSKFAAKNLAPAGFSFVQIDDKWQAGVSNDGPRRNFSTHDPRGPYPGGMKAIADEIKSLGLTPGIWFMPFAGTSYDPYFSQHQDWFVKTLDGEPYQTKWGGTCLDMSQSGAQEYLRKTVKRIAGDWGFQYFKIDGLWTGTGTPLRYVNSGYRDDSIGDAAFHDPNKTNIEIFRDGLKIVREAAGPDVFILGCNGPQNMRSYAGAMGLVDAMRIGPDNGPKWKQLMKGPIFGSRHYFLHGRVWYNDPDPVYVRESMPLNHAQLICSWVAVTGQLNVSSDWLPGLPPERLSVLKLTMPSHGLLPRPVDLFHNDPPQIWSLVDSRQHPNRNVIGLFNWEAQPQDIKCDLTDIGLNGDQEYVAYDFWNNEILLSNEDPLRITVPGESCKILALRPVSDHPQLLSTSRHVTQGIVDVIEETWDENNRTLKGRSRLMGETEYELRIVVPNSSWIVESAEITLSDDKVLSGTIIRESDLIRVRIQSPSSGELFWSVAFKS